MSAKRVLVTGATGFVGRRVCRELAKRGFQVRAAVRDAARGGDVEGEIAETGDVRAADWTPHLRDVDAVIHLAARVHVMRETSSEPLADFRAINVGASQALAQAAAANGVRRFVYVSSIKVNGEATRDRPFRHDDPARPVDPYGVSKWEAEQALREVAARTGLELAVVRPPLVYGPGVGGNFLRLLKLVRSGVPLPLGSVDNRRSMVHNGNLASALVACASHPRAAGGTYLVSDGEDVSTPELVRRLARALGTGARLLPFPPALLELAGTLTGRRGEVERLTGSLVVDASRMRGELDWTPPHTLDEGLGETARWFVAAGRAQPKL